MCVSWEDNFAEVQGFYQNLYTSQGYRQMHELIDLVPVRVINERNEDLTRAFTANEFSKALLQMAPSKAPGIDEFIAGFFQRHWPILKVDIVPAILEFLNGGELPVGLNDTSITLTPTKDISI
jgi:hypothetical protein